MNLMKLINTELELPDGFTEDNSFYGVKCPKCGFIVNASNNDNKLFCVHCGNVFEWGDEIYEDNDEEHVPECCAACGGPYPDCMSSCKLFDD